MSMFCSKCGSILVPGENGFVCPVCGWESNDNVELTQESSSNKKIHMVKKDVEESRPKATTECPKCGNNEAYFFVKQTRSADEAPTTFYECTKCHHKWRDYD